ncbi:MAG: hypothetical protein H7329_07865 [Opitutaceae bacterium]|nr:hypothetical protein [Cytophagales bacterium]
MKNYVLWCLLLLNILKPVFAQVPFAQPNQLPLLMNPSLAGAKEKKRISLGYNMVNSQKRQDKNFSFSYDQVSKKLGSGIGFYYLQSNLQKDKKEGIQIIASTGEFLTNQNQHVAGICIAPKYNIMSRSNPNKIKFTISPSLFFEVGKQYLSKTGQFAYLYQHSTLYNIENPDGIPYGESTVQYARDRTDITLLRSGFGFQVNSGKLILLSKIPFERSSSKEQIDIVQSDLAPGIEKIERHDLQNTLYSFDPNFHIGYSINKEGSRFSFTPIAGIGIKHYFNLGSKPAVRPQTSIYSNNLTSRQITDINYLHLSANFRYRKFLFGANHTEYYGNIYSGGMIGFQNEKLKIMGNFGGGYGGYNSPLFHSELTLGIFF